MSRSYYEILLSGPAEKEQAVRAALVNAGVAPEQFVAAHHGYSHDPEECVKGWVAYRADDLAAAEIAVKQVKGWCLRLHRHSEALKIQPHAQPTAISPLEALTARMAMLEAEFEQLTGKRPLPPMMGGALESPPWVIAADQHSADLFRQVPQSMLVGTGVLNTPDLLVTANSPAAMNVLVAAGQVWMPGTIGGTTGFSANAGVQSSVGNTNGGSSVSTGFPTTFTKQGSYFAYQDAQVTLAIASSDPTNPRIDLICTSTQDAEWSGAANQAVLQVVTGTPNASPSPTAPPANTVVVGSVWVPATHTTIVTSNINDLRPFARTANSPTFITSTGAVTIPPNAQHMLVLMQGSGGGGGGGYFSAGIYAGGGGGGGGQFVISPLISLAGVSSLTATIGAAGSGGAAAANGTAAGNTTLAGTGLTTITAGGGGYGGVGNATAGGIGGLYGQPFGPTSAFLGVPGTGGCGWNSSTGTYAFQSAGAGIAFGGGGGAGGGNSSSTPSNATGYGNGGPGGNAGSSTQTAAANGSLGCVEIIWLT